MDLKPGLYEEVISTSLSGELSRIPDERKQVEVIDEAEAAKVLSQYIADVVRKGLENVKDNGGNLTDQVKLANSIIDTIGKETDEDIFTSYTVNKDARQLLALLEAKDPRIALSGRKKLELVRPETSIAQSSLFTASGSEPQMVSELKKEIRSADRMDMLVSFIKFSGLRLIMDELIEFTARGGILRVVTTSYMGATDGKAVDVLSSLPNTTVKISYDTRRTRLHAKAYVFHRDTGFSTAYVGSSNLSNVAITSGYEWNLKVTRKDLPETLEKIDATFESYWNSHEFETYDETQRERLELALKNEKYHGLDPKNIYLMDVRPYPYQEEILDNLAAERIIRGNTRNLVVAATGTGKTIISAFDYKRYLKENPKAPGRLLFVAHREEILKQSVETFRAVLKDPNFGEMFVGSSRPEGIDHLFISIQTFNSQDFSEKTNPDYYDYIIVDEFHHAAAPTYQKLLAYYRPRILLGLTATPERMDGRSILPYFNNRIAAEIRLPEAIDRKLLCPFQYFGVSDTVDLSAVKWSRGGYDRTELSNIYTLSGAAAERRGNMVVSSVLKYVTDIDMVKGLGFCVSVEHAEFMSEVFNRHGIPSISLSGKSLPEERNTAKDRLVKGDITFIFVVDIYNEGVDIPEVNTVLFLRPTESLTVFLQQLGRGLRLADGKECLTVLDFIGQANNKYSFEDKFRSLLSNTSRLMREEVVSGFVSVPKGCFIQLEKKAREYVLENIRSSYERASGYYSRIASFEEDTGIALTLSSFLDWYHIDPRAMYHYDSFSSLSVKAGVRPSFNEECRDVVTKALPYFAMADSRRFIVFLLEMLRNIDFFDPVNLSPMEERMFRMFHVTLFKDAAENLESEKVRENISALRNSPVMVREMIELLEYRYLKIDFSDEAVELGFPCPLDLHCTYTRDQLLVAMDFMKPDTVREGVKWLKDKKCGYSLFGVGSKDVS